MNDKPNSELLPCPFCGGSNIKMIETGVRTFFYSCRDCEAIKSGDYKFQLDAIKAWNTRTVTQTTEQLHKGSNSYITRTQPLDEQEILELIGDTLEAATHDDFKNYMEDALDPPQQILQALKPYLKGGE